MKKGKLDRIGVQDFIPTEGKREYTIIFDFDDDWHCAARLKAEMSKIEVASKLIELGHLIFEKTKPPINRPHGANRRKAESE